MDQTCNMGVALLSLQRGKNISDDNLKYTKIATEYVGIEGGGGYYDANSGGYDVLGLGTLMYAQ